MFLGKYPEVSLKNAREKRSSIKKTIAFLDSRVAV